MGTGRIVCKTFTDLPTFKYERKQDLEVKALLEEFENLKKLECKPEHQEKWMKKGESPTRRLICK